MAEQEWALLRTQSTEVEPASQNAIAKFSESYGSPSAANHLERIVNAVSSTLDFHSVLDKAVRVAVEDLGAAAAALFLYEKESDTLTLAAERDLPAELRSRFHRFPVEGFHNENVVREARMNVFDSVSEVTEFVELGIPQRVPRLGEYACIPIRRGREVEGVLGVLQYENVRFDEETLRIYELIGLHIGIALNNAAQYEDLHQQATTDGLTGAYNRRYFDEFLASELSRAHRYGHPLSVLLLDIDRFKKYNDTWGHQAGDKALRQMVEIMHSSVREVDMIARYGGEEFVVILPETDASGAMQVGEKFRRQLRSELTEGGELTVSIGVSSFDGGKPGSTGEQLVGRADRALYEAKDAGRDCVKVWHEEEDSDPE
ncbi:MAG: GGDEF domain-containing protein [Alkalispirochaetaceae bacterium]